MSKSEMKWVFFGTPKLASIVLTELHNAGFTPSLIVCAPEKPKGRGLQMTACEAQIFGATHHIPVFTPTKLDDEAYEHIKSIGASVGVVAAYGKIIPKQFIELFPKGLLNVHPSLLPKFRGASPIQSSILSEETKTGVTIMQIDEKLDHGPIVAQAEIDVPAWPPKATILHDTLAKAGGKLLALTLPCWIEDSISATPQDETRATFTKKINKEDGLIDLSANPEVNLKKIRAYDGWPGTYFIMKHGAKNLRVKILDAEIVDNKLNILQVLPEGKKAMLYKEFIRGFQN